MITSKTLVMLLKVTIVAIIVASVTMRRLVRETTQDDRSRGHEDGHHRGHEDDHHRGHEDGHRCAHEDGHHRGHGNEERAMKCCFLSSQSQQPFIYCIYLFFYIQTKNSFPA